MRMFFICFWGGGVVFLQGQDLKLVVQIGHSDEISSIAFSPDEKYILTGSEDKTAKLWDRKGREIQTFAGHTDRVTSVAFSPDGHYVLTGSKDETAILWDIQGHEIHKFEFGPFASVRSVTFSPNGKHILIITECNYGAVQLYNILGEKIRIFNLCESDGFSPDGKYILIESTQDYIPAALVDMSGQEIQIFPEIIGDDNLLTFSPDGTNILVGSKNGGVFLCDLSGKKVQSFGDLTLKASVMTFSPDGRYVVIGSDDGTAKLWDLTGQEIQVFSGHSSGICAVAFSPDSKFVLTESEINHEKTVNLWDLSGKQILTFNHYGYRSIAEFVGFSTDGKYVLTGRCDKPDKIWDLEGQEINYFIGQRNFVTSVAYSPDGKSVLTGSGDGMARIWDLSTRRIQTITGHEYEVMSAVFSPDGKYVLTGSGDGTAKLWDLQGRNIQSFNGDEDGVNSVAFSPDGQLVLIGDATYGTAQLRNLQNQKVHVFNEREYDLHAEESVSVAFSPDGKYVLTGSSDKTAKLWDLSGREIQTFARYESENKDEEPLSVAFSPTGKYVLIGNADKTAKLWDLNGREIQTFTGHTGIVRSVAFSPDEKYVLTGSDDNTAILWDLQGNKMQVYAGHTYLIGSVAFSPDGNYVLTGCRDGSTTIWNRISGQVLVTLVATDSNNWIVTVPSGLFDASPGALKLMHYVQDFEAIELDQLKERYYEPGLLAKIMGFDKSELRNVTAFNQIALYPEIKASIEKAQLAIQLTERNGGLGKLSLFINDKEVQEDINQKRLKDLSIDLNAFAKYYLPDTINTIALRAYNQEGWLKSQAYEIAYRPDISLGKKSIPSLYALTIGTSKYAGDHHLDLSFADLDAEALAKAIQSAGNALFGTDRTQVQVLTSVNNIASNMGSKNNIQQAFKNIAAKAKSEDVVLVFFSGHGLAYGPAEKEQFYYLTKDIGSEKLDDKSIRDAYAISSDELTQWLTDIPAQKQVMIIDACNAGKVVESLASVVSKDLNPSQIRALDRMKDRTGMFILTGSAADKVSYEATQYGQGLLTYSLLQGMSGLALKDGKYVDVMTLFQYSRDQVPELAKGVGGIQTPVLAFPTGAASFDIGIAGPGVNIPVAQMKAVFIRNVFLDENFGDELGLVKALEEYFRKVTAKGAQAEMIYVDVNEYENGYSIRGTYGYEGDAVVVKGSLFKGKTILGKFEVTGKKSDVSGLVEGIVGKIEGMVK